MRHDEFTSPSRESSRSPHRPNGPFEQFSSDDVRTLIEAYPLAWVCGGNAASMEASQLPLVGIFNEEGVLVELIGHVMRSNSLYATLRAEPRGTILFNGPNGYISPEFLTTDHDTARNWAPTWNYAQLRIAADFHFDAELTEYSLQILIDAMEGARDRPWDTGELGARYGGMLDLIIGFRARVTTLKGKFKLGQDEQPHTLQAILRSLPDGDLTTWMRRHSGGD